MNSITKKCGKCNQIKNLEEFTVEPKREGGRHSICRKCKSEYDKKYKIENKEKIASRATDYWNKNKERIKKRDRKSVV